MNSRSNLFCFVFLVMTSQLSVAQYDPTNDLFAVFGNKCKGFGTLNSTALRESGSLSGIIQSIVDAPKCKGIAGALYELQGLQSNLLAEANAKSDLDDQWKKVRHLQLALDSAVASPSTSGSQNAILIDALKIELANQKINIAKNLNSADEEKLKLRRRAIDTFQLATSKLMSRIKNNDECLVAKPNLSVQIGAQILGLGATLSSGFVGAVLLGIGNIVDDFVSLLRFKKIGDTEIKQNSLGEAVACTIEGLSATYCEARDTEKVIEFNVANLEQRVKPDGWMNAAGLLGRDLEAYQLWISRISAGSPATTNGQASEKITAEKVQATLRINRLEIESLLSQAILSAPRSDDPKQATRVALQQIANLIINGTPNLGLIFQESNCGPKIFMLSGGTQSSRPPTKPGENPRTCDDYCSEKFPNIDLPDIATAVSPYLSSLLARIDRNANLETAKVKESNPEEVIVAADNKVKRRSARQFMVSAIAYLDSLLLDHSANIAKSFNQKLLIDKTRNQLAAALVIVDRTIDEKETHDQLVKDGRRKADDFTVDSVKKISDIAALLIPALDGNAIPAALKTIINQDIDQRMASSSVDAKIAVLMSLSPRDNISELIPHVVGVDAASTQLDSAQRATEINLEGVGRTFSETIEQRLKNLRNQSAKRAKPSKGLAMFCAQLLALPNKLDFNLNEYCAGTVVVSKYAKAGVNLSYDVLSKTSLEERICGVYDYHRKSYLYGISIGDESSEQKRESKNEEF